ncbi:MAG: hypothetical protein RL095_764 [Verrucomicrobiota bacterium]|jgi:phosphate/sulfate permease
METAIILLALVLIAALAFEYVNGFHDAANAIATVVSTKVLTPRQAIMLAAITNLIGAFAGVAVAKSIANDVVDPHYATQTAILAAMLAGISWNLLTWWFGIPSSSSHALIGSLCGAVLAATTTSLNANGTGMKWAALKWDVDGVGLWPKIVKPMFLSPIMGFTIGFILMFILTVIAVRMRPRIIQKVFGKLQIASAGFMGFAHGLADAQKTMAIIFLACFAATSAGTIDKMPEAWHFLKTEKSKDFEKEMKAIVKDYDAQKAAAADVKYAKKPDEEREALKKDIAGAADTASRLKYEGRLKRLEEVAAKVKADPGELAVLEAAAKAAKENYRKELDGFATAVDTLGQCRLKEAGYAFLALQNCHKDEQGMLKPDDRGLAFIAKADESAKTRGETASRLVPEMLANHIHSSSFQKGLIFVGLQKKPKIDRDINKTALENLKNTADGIPSWIILICAITMCLGTAAGGWRIVKTMGHKMVRLQPIHGFAAETTAASVLAVTGSMGMPVSTTHVISTSIMGVGASKSLDAVKWGLVGKIIWAWILTLPVTGTLAFFIYKFLVYCQLPN